MTRVEISDNIYRSFDNKEEDVILSVSAGFLSEANWKNYGISITYDPSYSSYLEHDESNTLRQSSRVLGWANITKNTRLDIINSFTRTEEPFADVLITPPALEEGGGSVRQGRFPYSANVATIRAVHQLGEQKSVSIGYIHRTLLNDDPSIENNTSSTPYANLTFWPVPNSWGLEMTSSYTNGFYDGSSDDFQRLYGDIKIIKRVGRHLNVFLKYFHTRYEYEGETDNYDLYSPTIGADYRFSDSASISLDVGPLTQEFEEGDTKSTVIVNGDFHKTWDFRRTIFEFDALTGYRESLLDVNNLGPSLFAGFIGSVIYNFKKEIDGDVTGSYRINRYVDVPEGEDEREDRNVGVGAGLTYFHNQYVSINLGYNFRYRDSSIELETFFENRVSVTFNFAPPRPYRSIR